MSFTGTSAPYEPPESPELVLGTTGTPDRPRSRCSRSPGLPSLSIETSGPHSSNVASRYSMSGNRLLLFFGPTDHAQRAEKFGSA